MKDNVMFDAALNIVIDRIISSGEALEREIIIVRDLLGRIRVLLRGKKKDMDARLLMELGKSLSQDLGAYGHAPAGMILFSDDLLEGEDLFDSDERRPLEKEGRRLWLLDRQLMGLEWRRKPFEGDPKTQRVTFFGMKGGVGRSTALAIWAWKLAKSGKHVLVLDLDLESPGISSTLVPSEFLPDHGIVDWFVEDGVDQAELVERSMTADSPLSKDLPGLIRVTPAYGRVTGEYLPKLARCYMEQTAQMPTTWGRRLLRLIERMETSERPDVVFLDSRAGLHDIAAVTVTRMGATAFLFAVESAQTWNAFSFLFDHWRHYADVQDFRHRLQMVASMVPETGRSEYLERFRERSWDLFRENLYDVADPEGSEGFSFDLGNEEAPHFPLPIFWSRALQEFDPSVKSAGVDGQIAEAAMGKFMAEAERLIIGPEDEG